MIQIALIAAMTEKRVIGYQNKLPWHFPEELKYFKKMTLNKPIIMGRKTFESMGSRPLPNRKNIILTQNKNYFAKDCIVVHSPEEALDNAKDGEEVMVIGGANVYTQFLPIATRLYLTIIHEDFAGDSYFPVVDWDKWKVISEEKSAAYTIKVFDKI